MRLRGENNSDNDLHGRRSSFNGVAYLHVCCNVCIVPALDNMRGGWTSHHMVVSCSWRGCV